MSFLTMRRMCLRCAIMKRKEITMWIRVYANWEMNFNSINGWKRSISYETKASILLSQCREWICAAQPLKESGLLCECMFIPVEKWNLILNSGEKDVFPLKPKLQYHLSNKENVFMVPNHKRNGDCCVNPWLSKSMNEL